MIVNEKFMRDFREYNKLMRKCHTREKTLEEYIRYRKGKHRGTTVHIPTTTLVAPRQPSHRELYPSYGDLAGSIPAKPKQQYTGTEIMGVAVMHKSNLVPVSNTKQAEDIAKMRRN